MAALGCCLEVVSKGLPNILSVSVLLPNDPTLFPSFSPVAISQLSAKPRQRVSSFEEPRKLDLKNEHMPPREDSSTSLPMATPPASPSKDQTFEEMN